MGEDEIIYLLISFILGWIIARMMGEGFSVGAALDCSYHDGKKQIPSGSGYKCVCDNKFTPFGTYIWSCGDALNDPENKINVDQITKYDCDNDTLTIACGIDSCPNKEKKSTNNGKCPPNTSTLKGALKCSKDPKTDIVNIGGTLKCVQKNPLQLKTGAKKKKHMHCKKHRNICKQRCNADCNEEMLTCQESKHDDNDNLLGASSYSRQDCCDRIRTHVRLDCEDNYNDGLKEYCSSETIQYKYDECMRTGKFPKFASCK